MPQFRDSRSETGLEKESRSTPKVGFAAIFSEGRTGCPVSATPIGECNAITNRSCANDLTFAEHLALQLPRSPFLDNFRVADKPLIAPFA
jgi:hypothetical protein